VVLNGYLEKMIAIYFVAKKIPFAHEMVLVARLTAHLEPF
jgi:hypothetical protein